MFTWMTLFVGAIGGGVAFLLNLPVPWLVGSLIILLCCRKVSVIRAPNKIFARWMRVLLGVAIGGAVANSLDSFDYQLASLLVTSILFIIFLTAVGVWYFLRLPSFSRLDAFMSALPGGLTFLMSLSDDLGDRFPKIALIHTIRMVLLIFVFSIFSYVLGIENSDNSLSSALAFSLSGDIWKVIILTVFSGLLADKLNIAGGHIMFPMIIASVFYSQGWIITPMPEIVKTLAMITFGVVIGCKINKSALSTYKPQVKASIVYTAFAISTALILALILGEAFNANYVLFFLALAPGSIAEISLIGLALGFDVGFIAVVHTCRYLFIMLIGAIGMKLLTRFDAILSR